MLSAPKLGSIRALALVFQHVHSPDAVPNVQLPECHNFDDLIRASQYRAVMG
jgi:hypothetical protein